MIKFVMIGILLSAGIVLADGTFSKHDANLLQLTGKINTDEKAIKELIKEKNQTLDPAKAHEIATEIKKLLKSRKENIVKYNKEFYHVEYEHPGGMDAPSAAKKEEAPKGGHDAKKEEVHEKKKLRYKRYDEKSIKEFEDEVNKTLSDVQQNIKKKYNP